jgi:hypothetical protein
MDDAHCKDCPKLLHAQSEIDKWKKIAEITHEMLFDSICPQCVERARKRMETPEGKAIREIFGKEKEDQT